MEEAATFQMPIELRQLFVDICCHCQPTNALLLFNNNLPHLLEDYVKRGHQAEVRLGSGSFKMYRGTGTVKTRCLKTPSYFLFS
jgi:hypothetical protein